MDSDQVQALETAYRYDAFLSYSTVPDYWLARRLESFLESFHRIDRDGRLGLRPLKVCRDASDFPSPVLAQSGLPRQRNTRELIEEQLSESRFLVVLCSANSARSAWVDAEIEWYLKHRGPGAVLLAVTEGDPNQSPEDIFSARVLESGLAAKPWYDLRAYRWWQAKRRTRKVRDADEARLALASHLLDTAAADIQPAWQRQQLQAQRRRLLLTAAVLVLVSALGATAWVQRNRARALLREVSASLAASHHFEAEQAARDERFGEALVLASAAVGAAPEDEERLAVYRASLLRLAGSAPIFTLNLPARVQRAVFTPGKKAVVTVTDVTSGLAQTVSRLTVWDLETGKAFPKPPVESTRSEALVSPAFSATGDLVATVSGASSLQSRPPDQMRLHVWEGSTGRAVLNADIAKSLFPQRFQHLVPWSLQFSGDGGEIALVMTMPGDRPGHRFILFSWDLASGRFLRHTHPIATNDGTPFRLSPVPGRDWTILHRATDTEYLGPGTNRAGSGLYEAQLVDIRTGESAARWTMKHQGDILFADFTPDGTHVVTLAARQPGGAGPVEVVRWDVSSGRIASRMVIQRSFTARFTVKAMSSDGSNILVGNHEDTVRLVGNGEAGREIAFEPAAPKAERAWISATNGEIVLLSRTGHIATYDATLTRLSTGPRLPNDLVTLEPSEDGSAIYGVSRRGSVHVWRTAGWRRARKRTPAIPTGGDPFEDLTVSGDARFALTTHRDREHWPVKVQLWSLESGREIASVPGFGHGSFVGSGRFAIILSPGIALFDTRTGNALLPKPITLSEAVNGLALGDNDANLVVSWGHLGPLWHLQKWSLHSGQPVPGTRVDFDHATNLFLGFSLNGSHVAVSLDGQTTANTHAFEVRSVGGNPAASVRFRADDRGVAGLITSLLARAARVEITREDRFRAVLPSGTALEVHSAPAIVREGGGFLFRRGLPVLSGVTPVWWSPDARWILSDRLYETLTGLPVTEELGVDPESVAGFDGHVLRHLDRNGEMVEIYLGLGSEPTAPWLVQLGPVATGLRLTSPATFERIPPDEHRRMAQDYRSGIESASRDGDRLARYLSELGSGRLPGAGGNW